MWSTIKVNVLTNKPFFLLSVDCDCSQFCKRYIKKYRVYCFKLKDHSETIYCSNTSYFTIKQLILQRYLVHVVVVPVSMEGTEITKSGMDHKLNDISTLGSNVRWGIFPRVQQKFFPNEAWNFSSVCEGPKASEIKRLQMPRCLLHPSYFCN